MKFLSTNYSQKLFRQDYKIKQDLQDSILQILSMVPGKR